MSNGGENKRALAELLQALLREHPGEITLHTSEITRDPRGPNVTLNIDQLVVSLGGSVKMTKSTRKSKVDQRQKAKNVGIQAGRDVRGAKVKVQDRSRKNTSGFAAEIAPLLKAVSESDLSPGRQAALKAQIEILKEESAKPKEKQDTSAVRSAFDTIKTMAGGAAAVKMAWDLVKDHLPSFFHHTATVAV